MRETATLATPKLIHDHFDISDTKKYPSVLNAKIKLELNEHVVCVSLLGFYH